MPDTLSPPFSMPPEWAAHERSWMAWPANPWVWGLRLPAARAAYAEVARALSRFEPVTMVARPECVEEVASLLPGDVTVLPLPHDDSWMRDTGPSFVHDVNGGITGVGWRFNGWGLQSPAYALDARIAQRVCEHLRLPFVASRITLEGGAVHVDGAGTALVCEPSVLDPQRNPGLSQDDVEAELGRLLGVSRTIWLAHGLEDDETRGHVDNIACFLAPGVVASIDPAAAAGEGDRLALEANLRILRSTLDARGRPFEIVLLPLPRPARRDDGRLLTRSYINFYLCNDGLIMPAFDDPADLEAQSILAAVFEERAIVALDANPILHGGGGIHCITQQQPLPLPAPGRAGGPSFRAPASR